MIRHGSAPFLECSSAGFKPFSAFFAIVDGRTIEAQYQAAKKFEDGTTGLSWKAAKGKRAINQYEVSQLYSKLWDRYIEEHPPLRDVLIKATGVSDRFGQPGRACQATELWRIRLQFVPAPSIIDARGFFVNHCLYCGTEYSITETHYCREQIGSGSR